LSSFTTVVNEKHRIILDEFDSAENKILTAYDEALLKRLEIGSKQIIRLLEDLVSKFDSIIELPRKNLKKRTFKMIEPVDLFIETFEQTSDIDWFFHMAHDADPKIFKALESYTNQKPGIYKFINTLSEDMDNLKDNNVFRDLKTAVTNKEYRKITYIESNLEYDNLRCLKLLFIDNNWYIATIGEDDILRLSRISFIKKIEYATNMGSYQISKVKKQLDFLDKKMQNSLTRYDKPIQTATLKIDSTKAKYFKKNMKKFMSTQKYKDTLLDGSILFTLDYTQPLEILPFIQGWLPHMTIIEPPELKVAYINNLNKMLEVQPV